VGSVWHMIVCGDGKREGSEEWDDGNISSGDGCNPTCIKEIGWNWVWGSSLAPDTCSEIWGDSKKIGSESWDDGNTIHGDGWDSSCSLEAGWTWSGGTSNSPDIWSTIWGDSLRIGSEQCDDGNLVHGDGCDGNCIVEIGWIWTGGSSTSQDTWDGICGDWKRIGSESWDDGNTNSEDGWDSNCLIEDGWICYGGTPTTPDTCSEIWGDSKRIGSEGWDDGNTNTGDGWSHTWQVEDGWSCTSSLEEISIWTKDTLQLEMTSEAMSTQVVTAAGAAASIVSGLISLSNPTGLWQMINTMQLFMLILLLKVYLPIKILSVYNTCSVFNLSFDASFIFKIPYMSNVYESLDFFAPEDSHSMLGIDSGSTLINILSFILLLMGVAIVHIWLIPWRIAWESEGSKEDDGCFRNVYYKLWKFMSFNAYLRLMLQSYQHLLIVSVLGLYFGSFDSTQQLVSSVASIVTLIFWIIFPLVSLIALWKDLKEGINELSVGLKTNLYAKVYQVVLILRRVVLVSWMVWFKFTSQMTFLIFPTIYQFLHICYILIVRPFTRVKDNIIEIYNELAFTLMLSGLIYLRKESKWNEEFTDTYVYLMMTPGIFMMLVTLSKFLPYI
jgi:cysteine-rich repeat protein